MRVVLLGGDGVAAIVPRRRTRPPGHGSAAARSCRASASLRFSAPIRAAAAGSRKRPSRPFASAAGVSRCGRWAAGRPRGWCREAVVTIGMPLAIASRYDQTELLVPLPGRSGSGGEDAGGRQQPRNARSVEGADVPDRAPPLAAARSWTRRSSGPRPATTRRADRCSRRTTSMASRTVSIPLLDASGETKATRSGSRSTPSASAGRKTSRSTPGGTTAIRLSGYPSATRWSRAASMGHTMRSAPRARRVAHEYGREVVERLVRKVLPGHHRLAEPVPAGIRGQLTGDEGAELQAGHPACTAADRRSPRPWIQPEGARLDEPLHRPSHGPVDVPDTRVGAVGAGRPHLGDRGVRHPGEPVQLTQGALVGQPPPQDVPL